ncbi:MAG: hypothetical protein M3022_04080 [Actinomycetota bacterium]|nr:hypothetical protein [Actinomycetota bacterium]
MGLRVAPVGVGVAGLWIGPSAGADGLQLGVDDGNDAFLSSRVGPAGVLGCDPVSEVQQLPGGSFVFFSDPDGNTWSVQDPASA